MRARSILAALVCALAVFIPAHVADAASSRAVVIVDTGSGAQRFVISFDGEVSGLTALRLAVGAGNVETLSYGGSLGSAVCKIFGVGNEPLPNECPGQPYWAYFRSPAGSSGWTYARAGASNTVVHDTDVEGWRFGNGAPPAYASFCEVAGCAPPGDASSGSSAVNGSGGPAAEAPPGNASPGGSGPGASGGAGGGSSSPPVLAPSAPPTDSTAPTPAAPATPRRGSPASSDGRERAAASTDQRGNGGGGGSPWGVVAGGLVAAGLGAGAIVWRRTHRPAEGAG